MKRFIILVITVFAVCSGLFADSEKIPQTLEKTETLLKGYTAKKMRDYGFYSTPEKAILQEHFVEKEREFKKELSDEPTKQMKEFLIGHWKLTDKNGTTKSFYLDISDNSSSKLWYRYGSERSTVYFSADGKIYLYYFILGEYIQQLKVIDGKIYVYYPDENEWVLDEYHEDGKFAYVKADPPNKWLN